MASTKNGASDVLDMDLYELSRVHRTLLKLADKPNWTADDTKSFDCMHYLGDAAICNAAKELDVSAGDRVLDIGSGFGVTGRYLHQHHHVSTIGIELQREIHEIAQTINERSGAGGIATSINGNFLDLNPDQMGAPVDHVVSFLCILHIPERELLFKKAHDVLKPGGRMYIEDFFARTALDEKTRGILCNSISCPGLPDKSKYLAELEEAGFQVTCWVDMSKIWTEYVRRRAVDFRSEPSVDTNLTNFYDAVDEVFSGGQVGGVRITCQKK
ncbi:Demethylrebeccamycin-D-glucose O-methyltransferase 2 [Colletotrichum chlorophyti]|uniref:Demethylrebeccamycin-D-glucose O-methyltransferase 2 n=1 Tax=Colletotrichum chlorophyti TaxID=708187 RepID=A0A1Q8S0M4_9PEZI|nr:Demethylrebeccamycin-D-glucose O-methyltransferase 2 [Colletotrichum chlorophyti]